MFKNRVRTAALAGAIAVATGVSGLTVPANAEIKEDVSKNYIDENASTDKTGTAVNPTPATGEVTAESVLEDRVDDVQKWVNKNYNPDNGQIKDYRDKRQFTDESEEALSKNAAANRDNVTAELEVASQNLRDVTATLAQANAETKAAQDAWTAWASAITLTPAEAAKVQKFVDDNDLGKYS